MSVPVNPSPLRESVVALSSLSLQDSTVKPDRPEKKAPSDPSLPKKPSYANGSVAAEESQTQNHTNRKPQSQTQTKREPQPQTQTAHEPKTQVQINREPIFVKGYETDDVFGNNSRSTTHPKPESTGPVAYPAPPQGQPDDKLTTPRKQAPRADRVGSPITPANAQGVLPPEACVFVANLLMARTDQELETSCHEAFDIYGACLVKIRRDRHQHPFALVQYYNTDDAHRAVQGAHDLVLDGRRIRTEPAQAKRSVILVKNDGGAVDADEARHALELYGPIEKLYPTTHADARNFGCPEGMWVEFAYYLDYKDALKYFNSSNPIYSLRVPPGAEPRHRQYPVGTVAFNGFRGPRSSADQKSIFLGNLPHDATETELRELFSKFGEIKAVNIIHKQVHGTAYNVFGFVEFSIPEAAEYAAQQEIDVRGQRIRVEPKEYSARRHTRLQQFNAMQGQPQFDNRYAYPAVNAQYGMHQQHENHGYYQGSHENHGYYQGSHGFGMQHHINPYHAGYNVFQTPPPTTRMLRRSDMGYSGSPHGMQMYSPVNMPPPPFGMDQMDDIPYGPHHLY